MALYENQIDKVLNRDVITKKVYIGTFARDELPEKLNYPCCFVLNTEPRSSSGGHWLAFYFSKERRGYFFDSYGKPPKFFRLTSFMNKHSQFWRFNDQRIQGMSEFCGYYCMLFLLFFARNQENKFFMQFKQNYDNNDKLIAKLISSYKLIVFL
jgi:hypothetical protein